MVFQMLCKKEIQVIEMYYVKIVSEFLNESFFWQNITVLLRWRALKSGQHTFSIVLATPRHDRT